MKSKYRIYMLLMLIAYSGCMRPMETEIKISELDKKEWHECCIYWCFYELLEVKHDQEEGVFNFIPLPFEIVGSKNFIAEELGRRLDNSESEDDYFKKLVKRRDDMFIQLKECKEKYQEEIIWSASIKSINADKLLPFILSLEESIKKRIVAENRTEEIEWRKGKYKWLHPETGFCRNRDKCLKLNIEQEFSVDELRYSKNYD